MITNSKINSHCLPRSQSRKDLRCFVISPNISCNTSLDFSCHAIQTSEKLHAFS